MDLKKHQKFAEEVWPKANFYFEQDFTKKRFTYVEMIFKELLTCLVLLDCTKDNTKDAMTTLVWLVD